jgi:Uma2 family endonuclease
MTTQLLKPKKSQAQKRRAIERNGHARTAEIIINGNIHIPSRVIDHDSFRQWAFSKKYPQRARFAWLAGNLWVEVYSELLQQLIDPEWTRIRTRCAENARESLGVLIDELIFVPRSIHDLDTVCQWAQSESYPEYGQLSFINDKLWVDLSMEALFHNLIKGQIGAVLTLLVAWEKLGIYIHVGMLLKNEPAKISNEPDGAFFSTQSIAKGLATFKDSEQARIVVGTPDMILEVISKSSVAKDTIQLKKAYAKAGISEYWLVDSTIDSPELIIMRLSGGKYVTARKHDGWVKSHVFARSFRLTCKKDANGLTQFNLETK